MTDSRDVDASEREAQNEGMMDQVFADATTEVRLKLEREVTDEQVIAILELTSSRYISRYFGCPTLNGTPSELGEKIRAILKGESDET